MEMIAFFLDNRNLKHVDFSNTSLGNPGSGATEYMTVLVAKELHLRNKNITLFVTSPGSFPSGLKVTVVENIYEAISYASKFYYLIVIRAHIFKFQDILNAIRLERELRVVIWAHLTPSQTALNLISKITQIKAIVCLENNQRLRITDTLATNKLFTIPYGITGNIKTVETSKNSNVVVYIGALVPQKGFHLLADAWPKVRKSVPDAQLYVIGSGNLYSSTNQLGRLGLASNDYEERIFRKLKRNDSSVHFIGNSNVATRDKILDICKLGVVNPSGQTETFCLSAIEFQQRGIPVIGGRRFGLLDTIKHGKTGFLILSSSNLDKAIIKLLNNLELNKKFGYQAQKSAFDKYESKGVINQWLNLFDVIKDGSNSIINPQSKKLHINSLQGILVILNKYLVKISHGKWPTLVTMWFLIKKMFKLLFGPNRFWLK